MDTIIIIGILVCLIIIGLLSKHILKLFNNISNSQKLSKKYKLLLSCNKRINDFYILCFFAIYTLNKNLMENCLDILENVSTTKILEKLIDDYNIKKLKKTDVNLKNILGYDYTYYKKLKNIVIDYDYLIKTQKNMSLDDYITFYGTYIKSHKPYHSLIKFDDNFIKQSITNEKIENNYRNNLKKCLQYINENMKGLNHE